MSRSWWYQKEIDWEKAKAIVSETESESETDTDEEEARSTDSGGGRLEWGIMEWSECRTVGC